MNSIQYIAVPVVGAFNYLGIASHRASHRRRREDCTMRFTYGDVKSWKYSELKEKTNEC